MPNIDFYVLNATPINVSRVKLYPIILGKHANNLMKHKIRIIVDFALNQIVKNKNVK